MAIQPLPAHGTLNWDVPLNSILAQGFNQWVPSDQGFLAWSIDPSQATTDQAVTAGSVHMMAVPIRQTASISAINVVIITAGVGLTAGQCFAGVYNSAGTRLGVTADQSGSWNTTGSKMMNLTAPIASAPAGIYYVAILANFATTAPGFARENAGAVSGINTNLTAATFRSAVGATAQTTLPASITMGSRTQQNVSWYMSLI